MGIDSGISARHLREGKNNEETVCRMTLCCRCVKVRINNNDCKVTWVIQREKRKKRGRVSFSNYSSSLRNGNFLLCVFGKSCLNFV